MSAAERNHSNHPESHGRHSCLRGGPAKHQTTGGPCVQAAYTGKCTGSVCRYIHIENYRDLL